MNVRKGVDDEADPPEPVADDGDSPLESSVA